MWRKVLSRKTPGISRILRVFARSLLPELRTAGVSHSELRSVGLLPRELSGDSRLDARNGVGAELRRK